MKQQTWHKSRWQLKLTTQQSTMERNNWQPQQSPLIGDRAHALVLSPTDGETAAHLCPTNTCETIHVTLDSIYQTDLQDTNRTTTHTTNRFVLELDLDITNLLDSSRVSATHCNEMILSSKHWGVTDDSTFRWRIDLTDADTSPTAPTAIATLATTTIGLLRMQFPWRPWPTRQHCWLILCLRVYVTRSWD